MRTRSFLQAGLAGAMLLAAVGCGAQSLPGAQALGPAFQASGGWSALPLALGDQWGWEFDRPREGHPFAYPVDFRVRSREGRSAVELLAREVNLPVRGFAVIPLEDELGGSFYDDEERLAKKVKLKFRWGNNTAGATKDTALPAIAAFFVTYWTGEKQDDEEVTKTVAIGYAWATKGLEEKAAASPENPQLLRKGFIYPPPPGNGQGQPAKPPMKIAADGGAGVDYRFIVKELGYGDNKPCGDDAFQGMTIKEVTIENLVQDVHAAFPETRPAPKVVDGETPQGPVAVPEINERLRGISAVAFGANLPGGVCSHASLLDGVEIQRIMK